MAISAKIYLDLLPWDVIVYTAIALACLIVLSLLLGAMRYRSGKRPTLRLLLLLLCVFLIITPFLIFDDFPARLRAGVSTNIAETSATALFPELRTRDYPFSKDGVYAAALNAIQQQRGWNLLQNNRVRGRLRVAVRVPPLFPIFTDDLIVTIAGTQERTTITAYSKSRSGRIDFGENRRHIMQFFYALEEQLDG